MLRKAWYQECEDSVAGELGAGGGHLVLWGFTAKGSYLLG